MVSMTIEEANDPRSTQRCARWVARCVECTSTSWMYEFSTSMRHPRAPRRTYQLYILASTLARSIKKSHANKNQKNIFVFRFAGVTAL